MKRLSALAALACPLLPAQAKDEPVGTLPVVK
jgi:hypothetical protein